MLCFLMKPLVEYPNQTFCTKKLFLPFMNQIKKRQGIFIYFVFIVVHSFSPANANRWRALTLK